MTLLTNPMTADLQKRIQNSSFGSPDYLNGFQGTMPTWQRNMVMNNYMPGLITSEGTNAPVNSTGIPDYTGYTPGVPPQFTQNPIVPLASVVSDPYIERNRGSDGERNPYGPNYAGPGVSTQFVGDNAFRINNDGTVEKLDPDSMDYKLANFMNTVTGFSPMNMAKNALGLDTDYADPYDKTYNTIKNKYGFQTAEKFANMYNREFGEPTSGGSGSDQDIGKTTQDPNVSYTEAGDKFYKDPSKVKTSKSAGEGGNTGSKASKSDRDRADKGKTGGGWCFDPNTLIQMEDGSKKKIKEMQIGDKTLGGEVTGVVQFKPNDEIHNYKGVIVAGSHFVKEDGKFIPVADSPHSIKIDIIPVVYSLDTSDRRIWINNIEFADFNGDGIAKQFLYNAGVDLTGFDKEVLRQVENKLI